MKLLCWIRSLLGIFVILPLVTLVLCIAIFINVFSINSKKVSDRIIGIWTKACFFIFGVRFRLIGAENLPNEGCLYLFNHSSFFDIFGLYRLDPSLRFGAKIELFKIPIFGYAMRKTGTLPIPRNNLQEAIKVYTDAEHRGLAGERFALSPEGGRGAGGPTLRSFKSGPFIFAIRSKLLVVPVLLRGAEAIWPIGAIVPATQQFFSELVVEVLPALDGKKYDIEERVVLRDLTYEKMSQAFNHSKDQT